MFEKSLILDIANMETLYDYFIAQGLPDEECCRLCALNANLVDRMTRSVVRFSYRKKDGSERIAMGTLQSDKMPETKGKTSTLGIGTQVYYDVDKNAFRCFTKKDLLQIYDEKQS